MSMGRAGGPGLRCPSAYGRRSASGKALRAGPSSVTSGRAQRRQQPCDTSVCKGRRRLQSSSWPVWSKVTCETIVTQTKTQRSRLSFLPQQSECGRFVLCASDLEK